MPLALAGFAKTFGRDPGLALRAIGYFQNGDLPSRPQQDCDVLRSARDAVSEIPEITLISDRLAAH